MIRLGTGVFLDDSKPCTLSFIESRKTYYVWIVDCDNVVVMWDSGAHFTRISLDAFVDKYWSNSAVALYPQIAEYIAAHTINK